ncbi:MAG: Omp28-related outer membrane protein [Flavobacteriales bacterium]|nr:Omp28-related outer membrane protein [Flavobacteriales bacterium]
MKNIKLLSCSAFLVFSLFSCNKIDCPYENGCDEDKDTTTTVITTDTIVRKILLEEYTGHQCGNCIVGAEEGQALHDLYGDQLILMTIHAGGFAETNVDYPNDYTTISGDDYFTTFAVWGNPTATISRSDTTDDQYVLGKAQWGQTVEVLSNTEPKLNVKLNLEYNAATRVLDATATSVFLKTVNKDLFLVLCIVEDSIIGDQKNYAVSAGGSANWPEGHLTNYVHRHMLRDNINGSWGSQIVTSSIAEGDSTVNDYTYTINGAWDDNQCSVIAFVYDQATNEILQAEEIHVVSH